jgi:hypothetical protein
VEDANCGDTLGRENDLPKCALLSVQACGRRIIQLLCALYSRHIAGARKRRVFPYHVTRDWKISIVSDLVIGLDWPAQETADFAQVNARLAKCSSGTIIRSLEGQARQDRAKDSPHEACR